MSEKRRCHRFRMQLPASFEIGPGEKTLIIASTLDVSATGLSMLVRNVDLRVDQEIDLLIRLNRGERVRLKTAVRWIEGAAAFGGREYRVGLEVITDGQSQEFKRFVVMVARHMVEFFKGSAGTESAPGP